MPTFTVHSNIEQANIIAQKLPDGYFWLAKNIDTTDPEIGFIRFTDTFPMTFEATPSRSKLRQLLLALGREYIQGEGKLNYVHDELQLLNTADLIDEWENLYGMSSSCLADLYTNPTINQRINNIVTKINLNGTSTKTQFEDVGRLLGADIEVKAGFDCFSFPITFPYTFLADSSEDSRFIIVVDLKGLVRSAFAYSFTFRFGGTVFKVLDCLLNALKPANTKIYYIN